MDPLQPEAPILLSLVNRPIPAEAGAAPAHLSKFLELKELWHTWLRWGKVEEGADFEDWVEQACRLRAVLEAYRDSLELVWVLSAQDICVNILTHATQTPSEFFGQNFLRYGSQPHRTVQMDGVAIEMMDASIADHYHRFNTFGKFAQRRVATSDHRLEQNLRKFSQTTGLGKAMVKVMGESKYAAPVVLTIDDTLSQQLDDVGLNWTSVYFEGVRDAFLLQEVVPMEYETRLFVVNGQVVTSAGCIGQHTPLDNCRPLDAKLERQRGRGPIEEKPEIVEQLVRFGNLVAAQLMKENPACHSYGLDVCLVEGRPAIIELNGLLNCGLYASDPILVVSAIRRGGVHV